MAAKDKRQSGKQARESERAGAPALSGLPSQAPGQDEDRLAVTTAEMIEYVKVHAGEQASQVARERVNFFFTFIGILVALLSAVGAYVLLEFNGRLQSIASDAAQSAVDSRIGALSDQIDRRFELLQAGLEQEVRTLARNQATLPLLVSEANALTQRGGYNRDDGDRILAAIERISEPILALEAEDRHLAFRRIEEIVDSFYSAGDYYRIYRILELFGDDLINIEGIHFTLLNSLATSIIIDPQRYGDSELYRKLIRFNFDRSNKLLMVASVMTRFINESLRDETELDKAMTLYNEMSLEYDQQAVDQTVLGFMRATRDELSPDGTHYSPAAHERYNMLREAVETAISER